MSSHTIAHGLADLGVAQWLRASDLLGLPGTATSVQGVHKIARRDAWERRSCGGRGGGFEYNRDTLPDETRAALARRALAARETADEESVGGKRAELWQRYNKAPQNTKDEANSRLKALLRIEGLMALGMGKVKARETVGTELSVNATTLWHWEKLVNGADRADWLPLLMPGHKGRTVTADCTPEAFEWFKTAYLTQSQPPAASVYRELVKVAKHHGWTIPKDVQTLVSRIKREEGTAVFLQLREGDRRLNKLYPHQDRDKAVFHAMEAINGDGHTFDLEVLFPDGEKCRPVMACIQDVYSAKILGWAIDKTENADLVRLALFMSFKEYGLPKHGYFDNGRAWTSKAISGGATTRYRFKIKPEDPIGILEGAGVKIHWAKPYSGQSKPIERAFKDLASDVSRDFRFEGAYVGNAPGKRPENCGTKTVTLEEFEAILVDKIRDHNAREGRESPVCKGRSFDAVFKESQELAGKKVLTVEQQRMFMLAVENVTANRKDGSITLLGNRYWCEALNDHLGKKLVVRFDPEDLRQAVYVYTLDSREIGVAAHMPSVGFNDREQAREHERARKSFVKAKKAQANAAKKMEAVEAARLIPASKAPEAPKPKVIEPVFGAKAPPATVEALNRAPDRAKARFEGGLDRILKKSQIG